MRIFVESVLRYGLPVNFQAAIIKPNKKGTKKLRDSLNQLYMHLDTTGDLMGKKDLNSATEIPVLMGTQDFYPYVYFQLNLDFLDGKK